MATNQQEASTRMLHKPNDLNQSKKQVIDINKDLPAHLHEQKNATPDSRSLEDHQTKNHDQSTGNYPELNIECVNLLCTHGVCGETLTGDLMGLSAIACAADLRAGGEENKNCKSSNNNPIVDISSFLAEQSERVSRTLYNTPPSSWPCEFRGPSADFQEHLAYGVQGIGSQFVVSKDQSNSLEGLEAHLEKPTND